MTRQNQTDPAWLETGRDEMFREYGFVRPDVEQVTEGLRVPPHQVRDYHDAAAADRARRFWDAVWLIVLAVVIFAGFAALFIGWAEAGPGCSADPTWLGRCADIPGAQ